MKDATFPYPFAPLSPEFCENNSAGDDVYLSIFKPCMFTFYRKLNSLTHEPDINNFNCSNFSLGTAFSVASVEQRKVIGWPDSCVANGPRCYIISAYPSLRNFTLFEDSEFAAHFPDEADVVSVDCSGDYAEAKAVMEDLPEVLQPFTTAIFVFAIVMFISMVTCTILCCMCLVTSSRGRRPGYEEIPHAYEGPPVAARKIEA